MCIPRSVTLLDRAEAALQLLAYERYCGSSCDPCKKFTFSQDDATRKVQAQYEKVSVELFYQIVCNKIEKRANRNFCNVNAYIFDDDEIFDTLTASSAIGSTVEFFGTGPEFGSRVRDGTELVFKHLGKPPQGISERNIYARKEVMGLRSYHYTRLRQLRVLGTIEVRCSSQIIQWMNEWKSGENKRYYELLLTMAKPYLGDNQSILKTYEGSRSNALSIYPMALEIPTIPVIAPNGRVYEKEIIESHLTLQSKKIKQERQRFEEPEYTWHETQVAREFIDSVIASCSFSSRELFSKKHLTYASQFTKMLIEKLNLIKEEISDNSSLDQQMKIDQILQHYIGLDQSAGMQLVLKLSTALFDKGATEEQCRAIAQAYTLHAKAQKVIRKH